MDHSLAQEFVLESSAALQKVERDLLILEKTADLDAVARIFRALHSIKGSARFLNLVNLERLAHRVETLLDLVRHQQRPLMPATIDALLHSVDLLGKMIAAADLGASSDPEPVLALLQPLIDGTPVPPSAAAPRSAAPDAVVELPSFSVAVRSPAAAVAPAPPAPGELPRPAPAVERRVDPQPAPGDRPAGRAHDGGDADEQMMRVRVRFLDELLELTGNMVMARNQLLTKYSFDGDPAFLTLSRCVTQVHKTIVQTRMLPIGTLFDRAERQVRDLARQLEKEVTLEVTGRELELDRTVIEAFADPLAHLIRNALDHGIETGAARQAASKPRVGLLKLSAHEHAGEVILTVADDGCGIDLDRVRRKAVERGVLTADEAAALSPRAALDLIFHPGFSTRDEVTALSGRGVGLDVVRAKLQDLGGVVEVQSTPGTGTAFLARLPLTQALVSSSLISALIVTCGEERYALPQTTVDEIIKVNPHSDRVRLLNGQLVYQLRELVLPVVPLERVLRPAAAAVAGERRRVLIVLQFRRHLFGLLVDSVLGVEEIVVRPLPALVKTCKAFSGHTVMGDGRVALLLDGHGIIEGENLVFADDLRTTQLVSTADRDTVGGPQRLVVFSYADDEHFAIPLEMVSLIEKTPVSALQRIGTQEFIQVAQRTLPVMRLDKVMPVSPFPNLANAHVLIPARVSFTIAVLAGRDVRVVDAADRYEAQLSDGEGTLGTFVLGGKLVVLLDLFKLFERHSPSRFQRKAIEQRPCEILLVEDSPFFQNLLRSYLEYPPRKLTIAPDGLVAWNLLQSSPARFEIVVSDIEMPRMDGFELIKRVRADPLVRDLPVIACTSMATAEHIERGLREGFDAYLIKADKEELLRTIEKHLERGAKRRAHLLGAHAGE